MLLSQTVPIIWVKVPKYQCRTCGYEWFPRNLLNPGKLPRECAKCRNAYWNEPRVYKRKDKVQEKSGSDNDSEQNDQNDAGSET